jgi:hypothetical protein
MIEQPDKVAVRVAEEILRAIYGDDLQGCPVTLDQVTSPIQQAMKDNTAGANELLDVYDKVVEAIHLLSIPPENAKTMDANALRSLLGERLDMIHAVTQRTIDTTKLLRERPGAA